MSAFRFLKNTLGIGLIEVMAASALIGLVSLGVMHLIEKQMQAQKDVELKGSMTSFENTLRQLLTDKTSCKNSFSLPLHDVNVLLLPKNFTNLKDANSTAQFTVGQSYENQSLKLKSLVLSNWNPLGPQFGLVDLEVSTEKNFKTSGVPEYKKIIKLAVTTNVANQIIGCSTAHDNHDSIWVQKDNKDIYYLKGLVGIGLENPQNPLHLHNNSTASTYLQITNAATGAGAFNSGLRLGVTANEDVLLQNGSMANILFGTNNIERMRIDENGKVGIGTTTPAQSLDVNGAIRIGHTNTCEPGTIRYNSSGTGSLQYCNNLSHWINVGGPSVAPNYKFGRCTSGSTSTTCDATCPAGFTVVDRVNVFSYTEWTGIALCVQ